MIKTHMQTNPLLLLMLAPVLLAILTAAVPNAPISAQVCLDENGRPMPCPPPEKEKKRPTVIYPSFTPTATQAPTTTVTAMPTATETAIPVAELPAPSPVLPAGFACLPFANSIPVGIAALGTGLLLSIAGSRQIPLLALISPRDPASSPPAMNYRRSAARRVGNALAGAGVGGLGTGALAGLLGLSCIGAPILMVAGPLFGLIVVLVIFWLVETYQFSWLVKPKQFSATSYGNLNTETENTRMEMHGEISKDDSATGGDGMYDDKELE